MSERESLIAGTFRPHKVAALYVETYGVYFGLPDVDPWDERRDARGYAGPYPVVAHPPCNKWSPLAYINRRRIPGYEIGDDGGCFEAALNAVLTFGGVLEHPAASLAWKHYGLPRPRRGSWQAAALNGVQVWVTEVDQGAYGHRARKRTWLLFKGDAMPPSLNWVEAESDAIVSGFLHHAGTNEARRVRPKEASRTPEPFRDLLLALARDLQDPDVGDARSLSHGSQALTASHSLSDGLAPRLFSSGTPRGGAAHAGQTVHLERREVPEHRHVGADDEAGAEIAVAVRPSGAERLAGIGRHAIALAVAHGANVGLKGRCDSGHAGNLAYRLVLCQGAS